MTQAGKKYAELRSLIVSHYLLDRDYAYYFWAFLLRYALYVLAYALPFLLPPVPGWTLAAGFLLGFANVQIGLIGHDAGHLAVFKSTRNNWIMGYICWSLTTGVGFWYWMDRHTRHHANTNDVGADPDLAGSGLLAFTVEDAVSRQGWGRWIAQNQAYLWPMIFLFAFIFSFLLRIEGWVFTFRRLAGGRRLGEIALLSANLLLSFFPVPFLGWRWLWIFIFGQVVTGLYLSLIIAPNHKGMPVWENGRQPSFFERNVISSRNVISHPVWDFLFGGLNYQIEHHLFPTMPRVHYKEAQLLVRSYCLAQGLDYEEMNPYASYRAFYRELRRISQAMDGHLGQA